MRNGLQFSFFFLLERNYPTIKLRCSSVSHPEEESWRDQQAQQAHSAGFTVKCWDPAFGNFFWAYRPRWDEWYLHVMSKFTTAFYNCKFCSTELKLDYLDNQILSLKDLLTMICMEENLLFVVDRKNLGHSPTLADMSNLNYSPGLVTYFTSNSEPSLCNYHFFFSCWKPNKWVFVLCFTSANFLTLIRKSDSSLSSSFIYLQVLQSLLSSQCGRRTC